MSTVEKRPTRRAGADVDVGDWFDRVFEGWTRPLWMMPFRRPTLFGWEFPTGMIRVDQFRENGTVVVRAELPGIDPDKDVEVTISDGLLRITAERRKEEKSEDTKYVRHELRYGSFTRVLPVPEDVSEADVMATYEHGVLEIRVPVPVDSPPAKIPITTPTTRR